MFKLVVSALVLCAALPHAYGDIGAAELLTNPVTIAVPNLTRDVTANCGGTAYNFANILAAVQEGVARYKDNRLVPNPSNPMISPYPKIYTGAFRPNPPAGSQPCTSNILEYPILANHSTFDETTTKFPAPGPDRVFFTYTPPAMSAVFCGLGHHAHGADPDPTIRASYDPC